MTDAVMKIAAAVGEEQVWLARDRALFWAYAAPWIANAEAERQLDFAVEQLMALLIDPTPLPLLMWNGALGRGWVLAHISDVHSAQLLEPLDAYLAHGLAAEAWDGSLDFATGIAGVVPYAMARIERGEAAVAIPWLVQVIHHVQRALDTPAGPDWWRMGYSGNVPAPEAVEGDCGFAHGVPGVVAALCSAAQQNIPGARALVDRGMAWIDECWLAPNEHNQLPTRRIRGGPPTEPARTAWCYGDLGVVTGLIGGARRLGLTSREEALIERARTCARRPIAKAWIRDPALCHGAMGNAHMFHRLYLATGDGAFAEAAVAYIEHALAFHDPAIGFGGYGRWIASPEVPQGRYQTDMSMLVGAIGTAMCMLSFLTGELGWDQALGIDIPLAPSP